MRSLNQPDLQDLCPKGKEKNGLLAWRARSRRSCRFIPTSSGMATASASSPFSLLRSPFNLLSACFVLLLFVRKRKILSEATPKARDSGIVLRIANPYIKLRRIADPPQREVKMDNTFVCNIVANVLSLLTSFYYFLFNSLLIFNHRYTLFLIVTIVLLCENHK